MPMIPGKTGLAFGMLLAALMPVWSQVRPDDPQETMRIEIPVRSVNETYRVIPCGSQGLVLFYRSVESPGDKKVNWYFSWYDTALTEQWVKSLPLDEESEFRFSAIRGDTVGLLFAPGAKAGSGKSEAEIIRILPGKRKLILNRSLMGPAVTSATFGFHDEVAWIGLENRNGPDGILAVNLKTGGRRVFPLGQGDEVRLLSLEEERGAIARAFVERQVSKKRSEYYLVRYDTTGKIRSETFLESLPDSRVLSQVRWSRRDEPGGFVAGSYGFGVRKASQKTPSFKESAGIFTLSADTGKSGILRFFNFLEMKNAAALTGEGEMTGLKEKVRKKQKSLSEYTLEYSGLFHKIFRDDRQSVVMAELFAPHYHTENFTDFDFYGRPYTNSYSVFDGYRFYHAVVAGFDSAGSLVWDNNIQIRNLVSFELTPKVSCFSIHGKMVLAYLADGKVGYKIIDRDQTVEKEDFATLDLRYPGDKLLSESRGQLNHWFGDNFVASSYQEIRNIGGENGNKRLVFAFSRIRFSE